MSSKVPGTTTTTPVPLSTVFCADDADIVIRAANALDFRAHKFFLSFASPIFKDMFTLPQPPTDIPGTLPHVDVQEPPNAWENILRTLYPTFPNPVIKTLDDLESLLFAARRYEMESVIEAHKNALEDQTFITNDPLRLYSIACACGMEDQANRVARSAELLKVTRHSDPSDLNGLTLDTYSRLVSFLAERDNEWRQTLNDTNGPHCGCNSWEPLYKDIKKYLLQPHLRMEEVYLKALEDRSRRSGSGCYSGACAMRNDTIKEFIEDMIRKRERVCKKFQPSGDQGILERARFDRCFD